MISLHPILVLAALGAMLVILAWRMRVYPTRRAVLVATLPALLSLGLVLAPGLLVAIAVVDLLIALALVIDLFSLANEQDFCAHRESLHVASLGQEQPVTLELQNVSHHTRTVAIRDGLPEELVARPDTLVATLPPRSRCRFVYRVRPTRRGSYQLRTVHVRVNSRWGLWQRLLTTPADHRLHVYPDLKQISEYALLARTDRLSLIGVRRRRRIGQDNEFERLRDYSRDDTYRHIDWRSTARRRKLTVKQYQIEQSQRIVFLVDCGRLMVNEVSGMSLLDHTFNALLMLSHIALKQGDAVGMMTFSDQVHGFVTPHAGTRQMNRLTHLAFDRFPQLVEPRFDEAFERLGRLCRKRSLLVLVTNIVDSVGASQVERHLRHVCGRHLPLAVLLRDRSLTQKADWRPDRDPPDGIYSAAVAARILCWREQLLARLKHAGCLTVDPFADELTAPLINKYLEVKARHLL